MAHSKELWDKVIELRKLQYTIDEISKVVKIPPRSIAVKLSRLKIYNREYKLEELNKLSEVQKAYIAGIIDGEGSIIISKLHGRDKGPQYSGYLKITNTDRRLIEYLSSITKTPLITNKRGNKNSRRTFDVHLPISIAEKLLNQVYDYLIIKKEQVNLLNKFRLTFKTFFNRGGVPKSILKERHDCYLAMKKLHKREF